MMIKRFLSVCLFAFFFQMPSYAQFNLIKDFDGTELSSFHLYYSGIVYATRDKVIVQYDSIEAGHYVSKSVLASINKSGKREFIISVTTDMNDHSRNVFFDFKTLKDGRVVFVAEQSATSANIIITDGTSSGTTTLYTGSEMIQGLEVMNDNLYFTYDGLSFHSLKKIDMTTLQVSEVIELGSFRKISGISNVSNTAMIFIAPDVTENNKVKLYVSDGTASGTNVLAELLDSGIEEPQNTVMTRVGNKVYFFYKRPGEDCCNDLWVTDGTIAGTKKLKGFNTIYYSDFVKEKKAIGFNDKFYFSGVETGTRISTNEVLWVSDGTTEGTIALTDADESMSPRNLMVFNNSLYFIAFDGSVYNNKLHKTDGTVAGTHVVDITYNTHILSISSMAADADYIYLGAVNVNASFWSALFRFNGSKLDVDILDDEKIIEVPKNLYVNGSDVYFTANVHGTGEELYTIGGDFISSNVTSTKSAAFHLCTLYPNPASSHITVKTAQQIKSLRLINQFGNVLLETNENTIPLESYSEGMYFVNIQLQNGETAFEKIMIVK